MVIHYWPVRPHVSAVLTGILTPSPHTQAKRSTPKMATPGDSTLRQPHSTAATIDRSIETSLSGLEDSVGQAGAPWQLPEVDASESHSHGTSQASEAVSGQIRNAGSAAFSSKSIEGESAFSQTVDACSISHMGGRSLRRRLNSAEAMSSRTFDVRPDQMAALSPSQHQPRHNQGCNPERAHEIGAGLELGGSGSQHTQRLYHQASIPSNMAIDISSRGGGTSISQAAQGQNFYTGTDLEVEMPKPRHRLMHAHPGSSVSIRQVSDQRVSPGMSTPGGPSKSRKELEQAAEDQNEVQASVSVTQRERDEHCSAPLKNLLAKAPTTSTSPIISAEKSLRHNLQAVMERTLSSMRTSEAPGGSASRNNGDVPFGFALPPSPPLPRGSVPAEGGGHFAANSGGCMVASAHGTIIPDDVVSDADTELALHHRRHQDQDQLNREDPLIHARSESGISESQEQMPAFTVHTVVGSVEETLGNQEENPNGNNSTVNRQASIQSGNPSTVNMSDKDDQEVLKERRDDILDTAQSENSDEKSSGESPKSVTGTRQGSPCIVGGGTSLGPKEDNAGDGGCIIDGTACERSPSVANQSQLAHHDPQQNHGPKSRTSRSDSMGSQCRKRKYIPSTIALNKSSQ